MWREPSIRALASGHVPIQLRFWLWVGGIHIQNIRHVLVSLCPKAGHMSDARDLQEDIEREQESKKEDNKTNITIIGLKWARDPENLSTGHKSLLAFTVELRRRMGATP